MKTTQLTIRGVDKPLAEMLRGEAVKRGQSLNRTVIALLRKAVGLDSAQPSSRPREHHDLDFLIGSWSKEEADAFDARLKEMRQIEPEMWK